MNAIEKLTNEKAKATSNYEKMVADALIKRCKESTALAQDVMKPEKTLEKCFGYIKDQARKQAKGNCAVIEDSKVYEWAEDYYYAKDEPKKEAPKEAPKAANIVKFDKDKAIAKATAKKPEKPTSKPSQSKPKNVLDMNKPTAPKAPAKPAPKPTPKPTTKKPEITMDDNGQFSLFGLPF